MSIVELDFAKCEQRVWAHINKQIKNAPTVNDSHAITASEIFGVSVNEVTNEQRQYAKSVNFIEAYGNKAEIK